MQKILKRILVCIVLLFFSTTISVAQSMSINIDGSTADASAMLEIKSAVKGLLIPRMKQAEELAITFPATGLLVYQTDGIQGLYINNGTPAVPNWQLVTTSANGWNVTGNSGTTDVTNFIGTTDDVPFSIRVNNEPSGRIDHVLFNSFFGYQAGRGYTTGAYNTAMGYQALMYNTTGFANAAIGYQALKNNLTGFINTAVGHQAMSGNISGVYNTAYGYQALYTNATGRDNTAVGYQALNYNTSQSNTAIGSQALYTNSTGGNNVAVGHTALYSNNTGLNNVAVGLRALYNNTSGYGNVAVGTSALSSVTIGYENTAVGYGTLSNNTGFDNTAVGNGALATSFDGNQNTAVGQQALYNSRAGSNATAVGFGAMRNSNNALAAYINYNVAVGFEALRGSAIPGDNTGNRNTVTGYQILWSNTSGDNNTGQGFKTLYSNSTGSQNTAIGATALTNNTTGNSNTAVGYNTATGTVWNNTTCLGTDATATASNQVRIGNVSVTSIGGYQDWTNISDSRFKENVNENVPGLSFISLLRPVTYYLNRDKINAYAGVNTSFKSKLPGLITTGFLAQEVEAAAKKIGFDFSGVDKPKNDTDFYGLRYAEFVVPLVKAVQEQEAVIKKQEKRIDDLEKIIKHLVEKNN